MPHIGIALHPSSLELTDRTLYACGYVRLDLEHVTLPSQLAIIFIII